MSYSIGLSGLRATNEQLGVISHNIANVNTAGFKTGRAEFSAVYGGGQPGGVEVSAVTQNFERDGDVVNTGRSLDLAISGSGFFVLDDNGQTAYTRAGTFNRDSDNYITTNSGARLQGYMVNDSGQLLNGVVSDLRVVSGNLPATASTSVEFAANLKADSDVKPALPAFDINNPDTYNYSQSGTVYDSLGTEHTLSQYFVKTGTNAWTVHYYMDGNDLGTPANLTFNSDGTLNTPAAAINLTYAPTNGSDPLALSLDVQNMSQNAADFSLTRNESNGYGAGELSGVRIEEDGSMYAVFTNGQDQLQGRVIMADFANPDGLRKGDDTAWYQSFGSGDPVVGTAGTGTLGTLTSGAYEGSNVELTGELVNLMTAQRNYQANAKSISTADQMTQVLFNAI